jgi:hypothetical protein
VKKKLLLTARDYSSGINIIPLYTSDKLRLYYDIDVLVSGASCFFFPIKKRVHHLEDNKKSLEDSLKIYLEQISPDVLMTGISGFNFGIDELALSLCKGHIRTFSYQDYWGYINNNLSVTADNILVLDEFARGLTYKSYPSINSEVVGSLKYNFYESIAKTIASSIKQVKEKTNGKDYWVFAGQPLWDLKAYEKTIALVFDAAKKSNCLLYYLPHPLESSSNFSDKLAEIVFYPELHNLRREAFVLNASKLLSCFSTLSFDILMLKEILNSASPSIAILLTDNEIVSCHESYSGGIRNFPLNNKGVYQVNHLKELEYFLSNDFEIASSTTIDVYKDAKNRVISCLIKE